jgi:hypothetical protein
MPYTKIILVTTAIIIATFYERTDLALVVCFASFAAELIHLILHSIRAK